MKNLVNIMQELGNDQRDEIVSSMEDLLVSMHVSLDPSETEEKYEEEFFQILYMKTRPEFLKTKTERVEYNYEEPVTKRKVKIAYTPSDIVENS